MGMSLTINSEPEFLRATVKGDFSLEEGKKIMLEIMNAAARHKDEKVLIDGRELRGNPKTIHRFYLGKLAAQIVLKCVQKGGQCHVPQLAYVLETPVLDPRRFGETVAVNRGVFVKVFDNIDDALEWLGSASA